ncbi:threonine-phosphate decarboxylase CobD [Peribacillus sp. SCS-155]|uniref:threonine-phosphate decarboxylase CobD n=1 Tax=Peribacillus sedimenti TaxID=3115297 RepID=UPI003906B771
MQLPNHGANPRYLYDSMNLCMPDNIFDFSANINPLGPPSRLLEMWKDSFQLVMHYPDTYAKTLIQAISRAEGLPHECIIAGNGAAELITLVARLLAGKKVVIIAPCFSEYEQACKASGCDISIYTLEERLWKLDPASMIPVIEQADAIFICTPNNPTGLSFEQDAMEHLIKICHTSNCLLVVDEAFYDFASDCITYASYIKEYENLIILRSLTKMYAIPGLRLGFLLAAPEMVVSIRAIQPHWSVNNLALLAGEICLADEEHTVHTRSYIAGERARLFAFFKALGLEVSPSTVNFYLLKAAEPDGSIQVLSFLLKRGIVPRHTFNFHGLDGRWLRFAIKEQRENDRLMEVLNHWWNLR